MDQKEHKKRALKALNSYDTAENEEITDIMSIVKTIIRLKAVEIGAVAPDRLEYKFGLKHRGFLHSQSLLAKIEDYLENNVNNDNLFHKVIISPFLIGYTSHLKEDKKTKMGIPVIN